MYLKDCRVCTWYGGCKLQFSGPESSPETSICSIYDPDPYLYYTRAKRQGYLKRVVFKCDNCKIIGLIETDHDDIGRDETIWSQCPVCRKKLVVLCELPEGDPGLEKKCLACDNKFRCITERQEEFYNGAGCISCKVTEIKKMGA